MRVLKLFYLDYTIAVIASPHKTPAFASDHPFQRSRDIYSSSKKTDVCPRFLTDEGASQSAPIYPRRAFVFSPFLLLTWGPPSSAADPFGSGSGPDEIIRKKAANLPGYGPPDLYYPDYFLGNWNCVEQSVVSRNGEKTTYPASGRSVRFIDVGDGGVVLDRSHSLLQADGSFVFSVLTSGRPPPPIRDVRWDRKNPNVLSATYADGSSLEIKVTKRALLSSPSDEGWEGSEYRRITLQKAGDTVPRIYRSRRRARWRTIAEGTPEGIIIENFEEVGQDGGAVADRLEVLHRMRLERPKLDAI